MANDTFANIRVEVLDRANQDSADTAADTYYATAGRGIVRAHHELCNAHPYLFLRADPPGVIATVAPLTAGTVQVTGASPNITFSIAPTPAGTSMVGRKLKVTGWDEWYRIKTHTAGQQAAVLDTPYNGADNAAAAYTLFQDEYSLASDVRHLVELVVAETGVRIPSMSEEEMQRVYPVPIQGWPPTRYARIGEAKIRFSHYPTVARRIEYPYTVIPVDIDGASVPLLVPLNWRYVIADGGLFRTFEAMGDSRGPGAGTLFYAGRELLIADDNRKRFDLNHFTRR